MIQLKDLKQLAAGLSVQFGPDCEISIYDFNGKRSRQALVYTQNRHVSQGALDDSLLERLFADPDSWQDQKGAPVRTADQRVLRTTTCTFRHANGSLSYLLILRSDITGLLMAQSALASLTSFGVSEKKPARHVNDLLDQLLEESAAFVGKPAALMNKDDKIQAVQYLNRSGAFLITHSGDKAASYFGISKYTLYSYIANSK